VPFTLFGAAGSPASMQFQVSAAQAFRAFNIGGFWADASSPGTGFLSPINLVLLFNADPSGVALWSASGNYQPGIVGPNGFNLSAPKSHLVYGTDYAALIGASFVQVVLDLEGDMTNSDAGAHNFNAGASAIVEIFDVLDHPQ
jgi:hypothetical protein